MAIQTLTGAEIDAVSGAAITVGGPGLAASVDPFALAGAVLSNTFSLAGSALGSIAGLVGGLLGTVTGLVGSLTGLVGIPSLAASASVSVSASASVRI